jgi:hypothetical protein
MVTFPLEDLEVIRQIIGRVTGEIQGRMADLSAEDSEAALAANKRAAERRDLNRLLADPNSAENRNASPMDHSHLLPNSRPKTSKESRRCELNVASTV